MGKGVFLVEVKRINVPKGTSGLSFRNVRSGQGQGAQGARASQRMQQTADQSQNLAYQIHVAPRSFFCEDDFNDITIEELAMYMEREEDFVEPSNEEEESAEQAQAQTQQQPPEPEAPVDKRKVAAVAAYDWFATL